MLHAHPILTCEQARALERRLFEGQEAREWQAMEQAGRSVAAAALGDFRETGAFPEKARLLVLAGKGHNAGDAFLAADEVLRRHPRASAEIVFVFGETSLRPLAQRAWRGLQEAHASRLSLLPPRQLPVGRAYDLCFDGIFGFQFRPPLDLQTSAVLTWANRQDIGLRAAIDLPSGLDAPGAFRADFTYATGSVKTPLLSCLHAGRLRYLDIGFFDTPGQYQGGDFVLTRGLLRDLAALRNPISDKRSFGHVFVLGGSRSFPGAALMAVLAALHSGAGLVTAFVPETFVPAFAARAPEAMWVGMPETPEGGLALEGIQQVLQRLPRASALTIGPGLGREPESLALVADIVKQCPVPLVLDADALQPGIVHLGKAPRILTPHAGEYLRIAGGEEVEAYSKRSQAVVVLKGPRTRITQAGRNHYSFCGGPALARGGSGDILAGLAGGLLAQTPGDPLLAAARGVVCQGLAADLMARDLGQLALSTTDMIPYLSKAILARADA